MCDADQELLRSRLCLRVGLDRRRAAQRELAQNLRRRRTRADDAPAPLDRPGDLGIDRHLNAGMSAGHAASVPANGPTFDHGYYRRA